MCPWIHKCICGHTTRFCGYTGCSRGHTTEAAVFVDIQHVPLDTHVIVIFKLIAVSDNLVLFPTEQLELNSCLSVTKITVIFLINNNKILNMKF